MIVLYWMTPDPIVATGEMNLLECVETIRKNGIRRLPVVDGDGELQGILGRSDIYRAGGGTELTPEVTGRLRKIPVSEAMTRTPATCDAYDHIETVGNRMAVEKVGAFPVLHRGHLVGIISEVDLLRALTELTYEGEHGRRITVRFEAAARKDCLYNIMDLARRLDLELLAVLTHPILDESAVMATLRVDGPGVDRFVRALWDTGYRVVDVS